MTNGYLVETEKLGLRPFTDPDLEQLYKIESDPVLKQYVGGAVSVPEAAWLAKARATVLKSNYQFALVDRGSGALAGRVSLGHWHTTNERELQLILAKAFVGRQLGAPACILACQYAFTSLGAVAVWAIVDANHRASLNLVSRLGFCEEHLQHSQVGKRIFVLRNAA